ncbi:hypothetical protein NDU88_006046 [Pleurodeles waltl]|uniref:Uncharacterized protein n=1 Tax=Pleurodeles waltl TaxID=8319 RepID=A0AAV7NSA9_PLEWA|nr:hypothetical protein NDU88_006046 [Pleurodeles waltl]
MLSTSVLFVQRYFLAMGVGPAPTPPMARTLRRALEHPIRCTAVYPPPGRGETALQRPLQVPWGRTSCLAPCSPALLPHCGCWARINPASRSCSLSRPQRTWVLLSDALQRVLRQAGGWPPFHVLYKSPGALLRASFLIPQRYFLDVDAGPVSALPVGRSLHRALSAHRRTVACSLLGQGKATPRCPLQVHWGCTPYLGPCSPALLPRCGCKAHTDTAGGPRTPMHCSVFSARPGETALQRPLPFPWWCAPYLDPCSPALLPCCRCWAGTDTAGGSRTPSCPQCMQRLAQCAVAYFLPGRRGGSPFNDLYKSPGSLLHALFLTPRCYFLVMGARPTPSPPADRTPSAHGRFIQCTAACFLLSRDKSVPSVCSSGKQRSRRRDRVTVRVPCLGHGRKPGGPGSSWGPTLRDQTPPCSSGRLVPPGADSTSRWSPRVGYF